MRIRRESSLQGIDRMVGNVRTGRSNAGLSALTAAGALVTAAAIYFEHDSRTAAVMRWAVEQVGLAARIRDSSAAVSPNPQTAARLSALGIAVSAQADDIQERADGLTHALAGPSWRCRSGTTCPVGSERPLPGRGGTV
jgi:hypothetical protein